MLANIKLNSDLSKAKNTQILFADAIKTSHRIFMKRYNNNELKNYKYNPTFAASELGLDEELVGQLVEDYITQILNTRDQFYYLIDNINQEAKKIDLQNLAHKNLGVAKNLRIEDAQIFLKDLMLVADIGHLKDCVDALESCAFKLNPTYAFNVLHLMEVKNSF